MVNRKHRLLCLLLSFVMIMSLLVVTNAVNISAASGDTVYCENAAGWSNVYCYMWKSGSGDNGGWPGEKMTKGEDNLWSYSITNDWDMIIFNNGSGTQSSDMSYQGNGSCFNNQTNSWSTVDVPASPTTPSTSTTPTTPTTPVTPAPTDKNVVFCKNDANWGNVKVYMWNSDSDKLKDWPGMDATNIGDGIWMLEYDKNFANIIFNDGNGTQTGNLTHPGSGQMYNNKTGQWSLYDTKSLHIKGVTADPASPQYTGVDVNLSVSAGGGEGALAYKFTVSNGSSTTVISDFSASNTATWTPVDAGSYTITYTVMDEAGATKTQTASFKVNDINAEVKPVVQSVSITPTNSDKNQIQKDKEALISVTAGGGNTGTKLLFYKVKITDPSGKTVNVPYYTTKTQYKFTPSALGNYEIEISVQASDNTTVTRSYKYESVAELSAPGELTLSVSKSGIQTIGSDVTIKAAASGGVAPYSYEFKLSGQIVKAYSSSDLYVYTIASAGTFDFEVSVKDSEGTVVSKTTSFTVNNPSQGGDQSSDYLKGDSDCDGYVNVRDATVIQKHIADILVISYQGLVNAEVDGSGNLTVKDATMIQKYIAGIDVNW